MVSAHTRCLKRSPNGNWHDAMLDRGIVGLLICTPLALASVPVWASSLMQLAAFVLFSVWLHKASAEATITLEAGVLLALFGLFIVLSVVQLLPMPMSLLEVISPGSASTYRIAGDETIGVGIRSASTRMRH